MASKQPGSAGDHDRTREANGRPINDRGMPVSAEDCVNGVAGTKTPDPVDTHQRP